jgi:hypothetical protein
MRRYGMLIATAFPLLLTGWTLNHAGWRGGAARPAGVDRPTACAAEEGDPLTTANGLRWRDCQPRHWRACVLAR